MLISTKSIKTLAEKGNKKAQLAVELAEKYDRLISTILIGNNIVNISASSLATILAIDIFGDIGSGIATGALTIAILIFGISKTDTRKFIFLSHLYTNIISDS